MKKRYSDEQIIGFLKETESGVSVKELCRHSPEVSTAPGEVHFLVFSNLWTVINTKSLGLINHLFPKIRFYRPKRDRLHWLYQGIVVAIVGGGTVYALNWVFAYIGSLLGMFVGAPTE